MKNIFKLKKSLFTALGVLVCLFGFISCSSTNISSTNNSGQVIENSNSNNILLTNPNGNNNDNNISISDISDIPEYSGEDYIILNNNVPNFSESDLTTTSFEEYSP